MIQLAARGSASFFWKPEACHWALEPGGTGAAAVPVLATPFAIGRAHDCQLVLPHSLELAKVTSRWHCYIMGEGGAALALQDGSLATVPETGRAKPSVSGTLINGRRLEGPTPLKAGDTIRVGPWDFLVEDRRESAVDIQGVLQDLAAQNPQRLEPAGPQAAQGFAHLQDLIERLHGAGGTYQRLMAILQFGLERISAAQVAAILIDSPAGKPPAVRAALLRGRGEAQGLSFSSELVGRLAPDRAYLLDPQITNASRSQAEQKISSGLLVPIRGHSSRLGLLYMDNRDSGRFLGLADLYLANALASLASLQLVMERQAHLSQVAHNMGQFVGPGVAQHIEEETRGGRQVALGGRECEATILFVDMAGFTQFCRDRDPTHITALLNSFYEAVCRSVERLGGQVQEFVGDGAVAVFGADSRFPTGGNHALSAAQAAWDMIERWRQCAVPGGRHLPLRVGLNTGRVVAGNLGFPGRMKHGVIGEAVNLAARMEPMAPPDGIALADSTRRLLGNGCRLEDGGEASIKGFGRLRFWRLLSAPPA